MDFGIRDEIAQLDFDVGLRSADSAILRVFRAQMVPLCLIARMHRVYVRMVRLRIVMAALAQRAFLEALSHTVSSADDVRIYDAESPLASTSLGLE